MEMLHRSSELFKYLVKGKSKYYIHSPFVYELAESVIYDQRKFYAFSDIEHLRKQLLQSTEILTIADYGSGHNRTKQRSVKDIAKKAAIAPRYGKLLFRLINYFKPKTMLELGTSLGLGTLYQSQAYKAGQMTTMEGAPALAKKALENMQLLEANNVHIINGKFEDCLPEYLNSIEQLDYVFFDGNHCFKPTMDYFEQCLSKVVENSIFVFDDIHWSKEMTEAWEKIKEHPKVMLTIDVFQLGIVFFKKRKEKEHFKLYYI